MSSGATEASSKSFVDLTSAASRVTLPASSSTKRTAHYHCKYLLHGISTFADCCWVIRHISPFSQNLTQIKCISCWLWFVEIAERPRGRWRKVHRLSLPAKQSSDVNYQCSIIGWYLLYNYLFNLSMKAGLGTHSVQRYLWFSVLQAFSVRQEGDRARKVEPKYPRVCQQAFCDHL